jgi:hypothetical protein
MVRDDYHSLEQDGKEAPDENRTCSPLSLIKSTLESLSCCWRPEHEDPTSDPFEKKYVHTPTHAASSFLKTATSKDMQRANEIL